MAADQIARALGVTQNAGDLAAAKLEGDAIVEMIRKFGTPQGNLVPTPQQPNTASSPKVSPPSKPSSKRKP
jgi:hypothetical protein